MRATPIGRMRKGFKRSRLGQGFTLVEVMVAAMILLLAMAGIVPFFLGGLSQASSLRNKSVATNVARQRMEQIRQLDYREITEDPAQGTTLSERFGLTSVERGVTFNISYDVEESAYEQGKLKKVTVNVGWNPPPSLSAASITTLIHQQFLGPRGALLELTPTSDDPLGTPFPTIKADDRLNPRYTWARYHLAQADWGLVFNNLDQPDMTVRNVYMRLVFFDDNGQSIPIGDPDNDFKIDNSYIVKEDSDSDGNTDDVYFDYMFDARLVPDGYWEVRAIAYNEYDEPGNVWRLRTRIELGAPEAPTQFVATPQADNETVVLTWTGGSERDRSHYVLERRRWDGSMWPESWAALSSSLDPKAGTFTDHGSVADTIDPWGDGYTQNLYQYRLWAVDISNPGLAGPEAQAEASVPDPTSTTTTLSTTSTEAPTTTSSTSTTLATYTAIIENTVNKVYNITIRDENNNIVFTGSVTQRGTLTVTGLSAGNFLITATASGRPTLTASFSRPAPGGPDDNIVLTIT